MVEHHLDMVVVGGSIPLAPTIQNNNSARRFRLASVAMGANIRRDQQTPRQQSQEYFLSSVQSYLIDWPARPVAVDFNAQVSKQ